MSEREGMNEKQYVPLRFTGLMLWTGIFWIAVSLFFLVYFFDLQEWWKFPAILVLQLVGAMFINDARRSKTYWFSKKNENKPNSQSG